MDNLLDAFFTVIDSAWFRVLRRLVDVVLGGALLVLIVSVLIGWIKLPSGAIPFMIAGFSLAIGCAFGAKLSQRRTRR